MKLTENFDRSEFACKCGCGFDTVDVQLIAYLEGIREHFDRPVTITSACRCPDHNMAVGGATNSWHLKGRAADIQVEGTPAHVVQEYCNLINVPGLGMYNSFTHIDSREGVSRWQA